MINKKITIQCPTHGKTITIDVYEKGTIKSVQCIKCYGTKPISPKVSKRNKKAK